MDRKEIEFLSEEVKRLTMRESWWANPVIEAINRYKNRAEAVSAGRNRITFLFSTYVIKIPRNMAGMGDNEHESCMGKYARQNRNGKSIPMARTRLLSRDPIYIIAMERVEHLGWEGAEKHFGGKSPYWVDSIDCGQVGLTRSGDVVAYDYGYN